MYIMLVTRRVLRFGPSVYIPLSVRSPFWLSQVLQGRFWYWKKKKMIYSMSRWRLDTVCSLPLNLWYPSVFIPLSVSVPPFGYLVCFMSEFNALKRKVDFFSELLCAPPSVFVPPQCLFPLFSISGVSSWFLCGKNKSWSTKYDWIVFWICEGILSGWCPDWCLNGVWILSRWFLEGFWRQSE